MSGFALGRNSNLQLAGVHPALVQVVRRAIVLTTQDFAVTDGLRTNSEQRDLVARGASRTLKSKHLPQPDGFGHAVDLTPWVNGKPRWEWALIYPIAHAMRAAAAEVGLKLVWGGVWDRLLSELQGDIKPHVEAYCRRHPGPDFIDGPHYQIA